MNEHGARLDKLDSEVRALRGHPASTRAPSSCGSEGFAGAPALPPAQACRTPRPQRYTVVVGGFPLDAARSDIEGAARELSRAQALAQDHLVFPRGRPKNRCRSAFAEVAAACAHMLPT